MNKKKKKMEKVKINGEELVIKFNLATELTYEEITNKSFDVKDLFDENGTPKTRDLTYAVIACVVANNPEAKTDADYILKSADRKESTTLIQAVVKALIEWLDVPAISDAHAKKPKKSSKSKNV